MGVKGLWRLLLPIGRRISIETLEGKVLAIDASIWLTQFLSVVRDAENRRSLPLELLIRRLLKLRWAGVRAVLVFDGATPEIKRRELRERRKRREQFSSGEDSVQRMAKKLLSQQLKKHGRNLSVEKKARTDQKPLSTSNQSASNGHSSVAPGFYDPQYEDKNPRKEESSTILSDCANETRSGGMASVDESKDIVEILDDATYLKDAAPIEGQSDWDTVVIDTTTATSKPDERDKKQSDVRHFPAAGSEEFDVDYVASLASTQRKDWVEHARRKRRMESRRDFMKVAYDSSNFSKSQLQNFLKSTKLNQDIQKMASKVVKHEGAIGTLAADRTKRIIFEKDSEKKPRKKSKEAQLKEFAKQKLSILHRESDEESEDIQWEDESSSLVLPRAIVDDVSSCSDNEQDGGFVKVDAKADTAGFFSKTAAGGSSATARKALYKHSADRASIEDSRTAHGLHDNSYTEDAKVAQELQDESLAIALQDAEYEDDGSNEGAGFLGENDVISVHERATSDNAGGESGADESQKDKIGGFVNVVHKATNKDKKEEPIKSADAASIDEDNDVDWEDGMSDEATQDNLPKSINDVSANPPLEIDSAKALSFENRQANPQSGASGSFSGTLKGPHRLQVSAENENEVELGSRSSHSNGKVIDTLNAVNTSSKRAEELQNSSNHKKAPGGPTEDEEGNSRDCDMFIDSIDPWSNDFSKKSSESNGVTEALTHAQDTASRLTNWAGRAFRRAVAQHAQESGEAVPDAAKAKAAKITEAEAAVWTEGDATEKLSSKHRNVEDHNLIRTSINRQESSVASRPTRGSLEDSILTFERGLSTAKTKDQSRDLDASLDEMKEEVMQLLQLFGVPYVQAPAEAEAQCVALEKLGLVDGIVTEDSDAFVFGGQVVYKNIFEDKKYVEVYNAKDAEREMNLTRDGMIGLAMLMGGDYTDGIRGVGIVNGMEILQAFDVSDDVNNLKKFRKWLDGFDPNDVLKTQSTRNETTKQDDFHTKHHTARNRWEAPAHFPDSRVLTAYLNPVVDTSSEALSWGVPDLDRLLVFCQRNVGWSPEETKGLLKPVLDKLESGLMHQTRIDSFMTYEDGIKFAEVRSKRLRQVLDSIQSKDKGFDDPNLGKKNKKRKNAPPP